MEISTDITLFAWFVSFLLFDKDGFNGGGNTTMWLELKEITCSQQIKALEQVIAHSYNNASAQIMSVHRLPDEPNVPPAEKAEKKLTRVK